MNIIYNRFNLHDTEAVICILLVQLNRADDLNYYRGRRGRDRVVGEYATTCAISAHHH